MKRKRWLTATMAVLLAASGVGGSLSVYAKAEEASGPIFSEDFESPDTWERWKINNQTDLTSVEIQDRNENQVLSVRQIADATGTKNLEILHEMDPQSGDLVLSFQAAAEDLTKGAFYLPTLYSGSSRLMEIAFNYSGNISYKPDGGSLVYVEDEKIFEGQAVKTGEDGEALRVDRIAMSSYRKNDGSWFVDDIMLTSGTERPKMKELPDLEYSEVPDETEPPAASESSETEIPSESESIQPSEIPSESESMQPSETPAESESADSSETAAEDPDGEGILYEEDFTGDTGLDAAWSAANQGNAVIAVEHNGDNADRIPGRQ